MQVLGGSKTSVRGAQVISQLEASNVLTHQVLGLLEWHVSLQQFDNRSYFCARGRGIIPGMAICWFKQLRCIESSKTQLVYHTHLSTPGEAINTAYHPA